MKTTRLPTLLIVGLVSILPLPGQQGSKKLVEVTKTETIPFSPGGAVHVVHSFGHLAVEGWDRPEVELTVIKSLDGLYDAKDQAEADKRLAAVQVSAERRSDTDLEIVTTVPHRSRLTHPFGSTGGVTLEYQIHVPRNAKLVIQHGAGECSSPTWLPISRLPAVPEISCCCCPQPASMPSTQRAQVIHRSQRNICRAVQ